MGTGQLRSDDGPAGFDRRLDAFPDASKPDVRMALRPLESCNTRSIERGWTADRKRADYLTRARRR